ncbi:MAG: DNA repair protein RecO [Clostridiales bacterium]|nr:DNA repair protein RecO [Clostridiales bacterium]
MASTKVKAIVLGGTNVKEKDKILSLYTLEQGKVSVSMKGVRGDKAKMKFAKEIFCFGDFILEEGSSLPIVTSVDIIDNFYGLSQDIDKYYEACAILDVISKLGGESSPSLFIELIKSLKTLCYENVNKYFVFNKFLINYFKIMGYDFFTDKCSSCKATLSHRYLNLEVGEQVCPACKNSLSVAISENCYLALNALNKSDYENLSSLQIVEGGEMSACGLLAKNYEWRTGNKILDMK